MAENPKQSLGATALYTAQAAVWGGLKDAELFAHRQNTVVFKWANFSGAHCDCFFREWCLCVKRWSKGS